MSEHSVLSMFQRKPKRIAIVMDEIDGMNNGDKGGINTLIKLMRPKKTKKQRLEDVTMNPIICIGNHHMDKKFRDGKNVFVLATSAGEWEQAEDVSWDLVQSAVDSVLA